MISTESERPPPPSPAEAQAAPSADWSEAYGIRHIAIIPDGNRRWARQRGLSTLEGHYEGLLEVLPRLLQGLSKHRVHTLTFWGFSTENWKREQSEVDYLMDLFGDFLETRVLELAERYNARLFHLGRIDRLPSRLQELVAHVTEVTAGNETHNYNFALDYGGEDELNRAARRMMAAVKENGNGESRDLRDFLDTRGQPHPNPDILIRSSGEQRMSGFLPLQSAYSEFFFVERTFPDFDMELLSDIAEQFANRRRRFGS